MNRSRQRICAALCSNALVLLLIPLPGGAREPVAPPADTLARIGVAAITARDLVKRIELMPFPGRQTAAQAESLKARTLRTMVAERLLAGEAFRVGLGNDSRLALMRRELENLLIRDELYRREVVARAIPAPAAIDAGTLRYASELHLLAFTVSSRRAGELLAEKLQRAAPDSARRISPSYYLRVDTLTMTFGFPDTSLEEAAYGIGRGRVSSPFLSRSGAWGLLYLMSRKPNGESRKLSPPDMRRKVAKILQDRNEARIVEEYWYRTLRDKKADAVPATFSLLADSLSALWREAPARFRRKEYYLLTSDMVDLLLDRLRHRLGEPLVRTDGGDLSLGQMLEMLRYEDYGSRAMAGDSFRIDLNEEIRSLVARAFLAEEGKRLGLQQASGVREDLQMWEEYWAAGDLVRKIRDSVSVGDEEITAHLVKNTETLGKYEVNIREVLVDRLSDAATAMEELSRGESLASVAARMSKRTEWKGRGGESGFFPIRVLPALGFRAMAADTGRLLGPVKLPEGYSIFTVLGKRRLPGATTGFDTLHEIVRDRLLGEKRNAVLRRTIATLAQRERVTINAAALRRVKITTIPMFTRRQIGFGGRMNPVPLLMRQWDWIEELQAVPPLP